MALNSVISVPVGWLCVISMIKSIPVPVQVALGSAIAVPVWWLCVISMIKGIPVGTAPQQMHCAREQQSNHTQNQLLPMRLRKQPCAATVQGYERGKILYFLEGR
eukprot:scaffold109574_cov16-Tisochrysis_lutea.AAC.1